MATVARTVSVSANAGLLIQAVFQIRSGQRRLASGAVSRICVNVGTTCWANSLERLIKGEMIPSLIRLLVNLEVGVNVVFGNNRGQKRAPAVFLASEDAKYITGRPLYVSGGAGI